MPDAMSEASLSLIRSRTVRRPISALRCGTWAKTLIGGARKLIPPNCSRPARLVTRPARGLAGCQACAGVAKPAALSFPAQAGGPLALACNECQQSLYRRRHQTAAE